MTTYWKFGFMKFVNVLDAWMGLLILFFLLCYISILGFWYLCIASEIDLYKDKELKENKWIVTFWFRKIWNLVTIQGFHMTSYQAISASHHTHDCHVGFLFTVHG